MSDFPLFMALTAVMGLSIFLSLPIVYSRRAQGRWSVALNAAAIGILVFLLADVFSDVSTILYPSGYVANRTYSVLFVAAFVGAFLALYVADNLPRAPPRGVSTDTERTSGAEFSPRRTAAMIALGIGFQNLTEGLVFGVNWSAGTVGILAVVFVGFFLQNVTEGFPIASPFLGVPERRAFPLMAGLFFLGGLPTLIGGTIGYFWSSNLFLLFFDGLAIGAITYAILPMLRVAFRPLATRELSVRRNQLVYLGIMVGFVAGFVVNAL
jgi:ZIP family zinc transporter